MTGADKHFNKKVIKVTQSRNLKDDNDYEDPARKSQYNDDRDLSNFESEQTHRHQVRSMNAMDEIDPSDSEVHCIAHHNLCVFPE